MWKRWPQKGKYLLPWERFPSGRLKSSVKKRIPEYTCWQNIKCRCYRKSYRDYYLYGGRGIQVCDRWRYCFDNFVRDMWPRPSKKYSIERIDTNWDYEPSNCKWADKFEQAKNKRNTLWIEYKWETKCLAEWVRDTGIHRETLKHRLYSLWWTPEKAFTTEIIDSKFNLPRYNK